MECPYGGAADSSPLLGAVLLRVAYATSIISWYVCDNKRRNIHISAREKIVDSGNILDQW